MGTEYSRIFSSTISGKGLCQGFHQGVWFLFIVFFFFLLRCRLASFPEEFLSSLLIPDDCLTVRMHLCFTLYQQLYSSSRSNSTVYRLNSWLHSISVWVFDKGFWWNPFRLFSWNLFAVCSLGHEMQQGSCWLYWVHLCRGLNPVYVILREICLHPWL